MFFQKYLITNINVLKINMCRCLDNFNKKPTVIQSTAIFKNKNISLMLLPILHLKVN